MLYAKIDWYTVLLYNTSFKDVLEKLNCFADVCDEILNSGYQRSVGYRTDIVYSSNGVNVSVKMDDTLGVDEENMFFNKWSELRLDISGQGLDYLRALNDNLDLSLCDIHFWGDELSFKITRCDFAFDFVNYYSSFLDEFIFKLQDLERSFSLSRGSDGNIYLGTVGKGGSFGRRTAYNYRVGSDVKCLYLGTVRSDKLVRIYDKKLEQSKGGVFLKPLPKYFADNGDGEVNSWFRIEFQTRRKFAHKYLFGCGGDLKVVLRELFDTYQCKDPTTGQAFEFIKKLYNWDSLPKFIDNLHFTELPVAVIIRAERQLTTQAIKNLTLYYGVYGINGILSLIQNYLDSINDPGECLSLINSNIAFRNRYSRLLAEENLSELWHLHYKDDKFSIGDWRSV